MPIPPKTPSSSHFLDRAPAVIGSASILAAALLVLADPAPDLPVNAAAVATVEQEVATRRGLRNVAVAVPSGAGSVDQGEPMRLASAEITSAGMILTHRGLRDAPPVARAPLAGDADGLPAAPARSRR